MTGFFTVVFILWLLHMVVYILNDLSLEKKGDSKYYQILHSLVKWMTFGAYIRLFMFSYLFFLIISINEVKNPGNKNYDSTSYYFSCILLIVTLMFTVLISVHAFRSSPDENSENNDYACEIFNAIRPSKLCRFYYPVFLLRRLIFVAILFTVENLSHEIKIALFWGTQVLYFLYILISRPFIRTKDNIGEIMNEIFISFFFAFLIWKVNAEKWSDMEAVVFYGAIITNVGLFAAIALSRFSHTIFNLCLVGFLAGLMTELEEREGIQINNHVIVSLE